MNTCSISTVAELKELSFPEFWDVDDALEQNFTRSEEGTAVMEIFGD